MTKTLIRWVIVLLVVCAAAGAGVLAWHASAKVPPPVLTGPTTIREAYWHERIAKVGPTKAYAEFSAAVAPLPITAEHENAHVFGGALFAVAGLPGIATCDARFNFGCYHEFLGRAIATMGLGVVGKLNAACMENLKTSPLSCQHGIGHGVEAAEGYDETALGKSLAICKSLPGNDTIGGCYGGTFMEYNMQTMLGDEGRTRPVHAGDPYYPCDTLEATYLPACAFWSPSWWAAVGYVDAAKIGALCDGVGSATLVRDCYQGLGVEAPARNGYDPVKTAAFCEASSPSALERLYCKSYAANALNVGGGGEANGVRVCDGLTGDYLSYCTAYALNKANQATDLPAFTQEKV